MKNESHKPIDGNGTLILEGNWVTFTEAPASLLEGLPDEDQAAIKLQAGKPMQVVGFDEYGYVEMEISGTYRTIWVEPKDLFKVEHPSSDSPYIWDNFFLKVGDCFFRPRKEFV